MLPKAYQSLEASGGLQVINACDPAQVYGKILPHSESLLPFTNIPGTVIVSKAGKPIMVLERFGERIQLSGSPEEVTEAAQAFKKAFTEKRIWPDRKKVVVKQWPEDTAERDTLKVALKAAGF